MKTLKLHGEYTLATVFLPAIVNNDYSGLEPVDEIVIDEFIRGLPNRFTIDIKDGSNFAKCDACDLLANCVQVSIYS